MKIGFGRIFIAAVGLIFALSAAAQELIELPDFGDSAGAIISPEQEKRIGEDFMRQIRRLAPLMTDEEVEDYIQELGESMSKLTDYYGDFTFLVIDSPAINAFAVPGGLVAFYSGLILETQSEAELASVIAHEISHVTQRHAARMIEEASQMNIPMIAAMIGAIALAAVNPEAGSAALIATQAAAQQHQLNFTRANEKEADNIGIRLMSQAGYDSQKMAVFFERMQRAATRIRNRFRNTCGRIRSRSIASLKPEVEPSASSPRSYAKTAISITSSRPSSRWAPRATRSKPAISFKQSFEMASIAMKRSRATVTHWR